ncbi:helix-turn-helix domain-containing protein [Lentzea californiensis]|uniref:helix-turn-helix domain-containing protein n=1 Tax=Lentzea californiensis TaxID=438851 RepID=UPI0021642ED0|nr:helix-turn-helix domain-containing protein [Lentzea californiensis]
MSIEAIAWALNTAPIPTNRKTSSSLAVVLIGLANHADPFGRNSFPSVATLTRYTRLSERTVRTTLDRLHALRLIKPSDPDILAAHIKRADRRPQGWDLAMCDEVHVSHLAEQDGVQSTATRCNPRRNGVQALHPILPLTVRGTVPRGARPAGARQSAASATLVTPIRCRLGSSGSTRTEPGHPCARAATQR